MLLDLSVLRAPSRRVWWVGFGVAERGEWGVVCAATTAAVGVIETGLES